MGVFTFFLLYRCYDMIEKCREEKFTVKIHLFRNHLNRKKGKQKPLN